MNIFKKFTYRLTQKFFYVALAILNFKEPNVIEGGVEAIKDILRKEDKHKPLIVTDKMLHQLGLLDTLKADLEKHNIDYIIFDDTTPNPTTVNAEATVKLYQDNKCDALIGFGGGSSMDLAKITGALVNNPHKTINDLRGVLKIQHKLPLLIAVATTAGTGSEATVASVIVNPVTHEKFAVNDPKLIPAYAILDPNLTVGLSKRLTSTTGMDALTHAVECFTNSANTKKTYKYSLDAIKLIYENLKEAVDNPTNIDARKNMLIASYKAGVAFTRGYVGNVHAIAHTFGGFYNVPHGYANAVILPHVLKYYGSTIYNKLAIIADYIGIKGSTNEEKANNFIKWIEDFNEYCGIPKYLDKVNEADLDKMIHNAYHEANPLYPVPVMFDYNDFKYLYNEVTNNK